MFREATVSGWSTPNTLVVGDGRLAQLQGPVQVTCGLVGASQVAPRGQRVRMVGSAQAFPAVGDTGEQIDGGERVALRRQEDPQAGGQDAEQLGVVVGGDVIEQCPAVRKDRPEHRPVAGHPVIGLDERLEEAGGCGVPGGGDVDGCAVGGVIGVGVRANAWTSRCTLTVSAVRVIML